MSCEWDLKPHSGHDSLHFPLCLSAVPTRIGEHSAGCIWAQNLNYLYVAFIYLFKYRCGVLLHQERSAKFDVL